MNLLILAQAAEKASETAAVQAETTDIVPMDLIWEQISALTWLQALVAVSFGAVYLLYGWRIFKVLAVVCFGMVGLFSGMKLGEMLGSVLWGGVIGLVSLGLLSIPLMRWAVSILGAISGGIVTSGIWYAVGLPEQYIWAGAVIGIVAGGMISFIVFKISVILFTSMGGATLIVVGMLGLFHLYELAQTDPTDYVQTLVNQQNWFLPVILIFTTAIGIVIQNKLVRKSAEWEL
ncbi:MAG: hypothetical protein K8R02_08695 [Anaerohalosphaeraceae bacterium]|nr:hypothetical protein [Anaerohalosphaeraceae bacterium]